MAAGTRLLFNRRGDPRFINASAVGGFAVTPNDSTVFAIATRQFRVGTGGGNIKVRFVSGEDLVIPNVLDGETFDYQIDKVYATGTTVTGITAVY